MAKSSVGVEVTLSVLDRLIDYQPDLRTEALPSRTQSVKDLKEAVRRNLEWILNTRRIAEPPDENLRELWRSVYLFGLQDFTAFSVASAKEQSRLIKAIQTAVRLFEPRISGAKIVDLRPPDINTRALRLRIEGLLVMDPAPEHVSFDTVLQISSGTYEVQHAG